MNLLLWKEELVRDYSTALARARAGAAYLDKLYGANWVDVIDVARLNIASPFNCVLGQLNSEGYFCLPSPRRGVDCGFSCGIFLDIASLFLPIPAIKRSFELLSKAWKAVIRQRRGPSLGYWLKAENATRSARSKANLATRRKDATRAASLATCRT